MNGEKPVRRSTKLNNWMIGVGLAVISASAYVLIALRVLRHGIN